MTRLGMLYNHVLVLWMLLFPGYCYVTKNKDCRNWEKGFRKIGDSAYICLPQFEGRKIIHHCPSRYSIPQWYSMGLTEPCTCRSVPYRGTMKKICPSPPLRRSYGRDYYNLPSLKLDRFAAAARYRGQWSDPRDYLHNDFKQREYDDRALFQHRVVRVGHTVIRRPTAPTPFQAAYTAPAMIVSTPPATGFQPRDFRDPRQKSVDQRQNTGLVLEQGLPSPVTTFSNQQSVANRFSSLLGNQFPFQNQPSVGSVYSYQGRSQIRPNSYIQNNPFSQPRAQPAAPQLPPNQQIPLEPYPTYVPQGSGDVEQPKLNQNQNQNNQNQQKLNNQDARILTPAEQNTLQQLQRLSQTFQNQPNSFETGNASLLLPDDILPTLIKELQRQEKVSESNSEKSGPQQIPAQSADPAPIPVAPTFIPAAPADNSPVPINGPPTADNNPSSYTENVGDTGIAENNPSSFGQNFEQTNTDQSPDTPSIKQDNTQIEKWNETTRQQYQRQLPIESGPGEQTKNSKMPVVIHTSSGRIVRIDPRFMDISALMNVFHKQHEKKSAKQVSVETNRIHHHQIAKHVPISVSNTQKIDTIGDASPCADDPYIKFNNKFRSLTEGIIVNLDKARRFGSKEDECKFECLMDNMCREVQFSPGFQGQFCTKFYEKTCIDSLSGTALPGQSIYWRKVDCSVNNGRGDGDPENCNSIKPTPPFVPTGEVIVNAYQGNGTLVLDGEQESACYDYCMMTNSCQAVDYNKIYQQCFAHTSTSCIAHLNTPPQDNCCNHYKKSTLCN